MTTTVPLAAGIPLSSFAVIYSLTEIPLMLATIALFRRWQESVAVRREARLA